MDKYLPFLYNLAKKSFENGDIPVACVIIKDDKIFASGFNNRFYSSRVIGHAEINAIIEAEEKINDFRLNGFTMITTLKPCTLCYEAIEASRIDKIYYLLDQDIKKSYPQDKYIKLNFNDNIYFKKYQILFDNFFKNIR